MKFKDKTVVVTGSRRGIGLGIALEFAKFGANVVLNGTREIDAETLAQFDAYPGEVMTFVGDVSKFDVAENFINEVKERFGRIDGYFNMIRFATPVFVKQKSGSIINITSIVGVTGNAGQANYAASKAGIIGLTKSVAKEIGSRGITVNAIAPGYIDTDMTQALPEKIRNEWEKQIPLRRFGTVEDIAEACVFLAEAKYVTGQVLNVNGGLYM